VFSTDQAVRAGWSVDALRHAVRVGRIQRMRRGVYRMGDVAHLDQFTHRRWDHAAPAIAAALTVPGALPSHSTAAVLLDLPLLSLPVLPCLSVVPWHTGEISGVHVHRTSVRQLTLVAGIECTSVGRTVLDLAREHGEYAGVVAADGALHERRCTRAEMQEVLADCRGWPGVRAARRAFDVADGRSESVLESLSRLKITASALQLPTLQSVIERTDGTVVGRVDFYWDAAGVVGEADGMGKYDTDPAALRKEKQRQEKLEELGLIVVRWGWEDLTAFDRVIERLRRAHARGQRRAGADRRWFARHTPPL